MSKRPHVAVVLSGCGHVDGAETREAVLALLALDEHGATFQVIAPNAPQHDVINHATGQPVAQATRNMLEEAARIARVKQCLDLAHASPSRFDALVLPGGLGVAKTLCNFAKKGRAAEVRPDIAEFVKAFFQDQKPVGAICIAPALVGLVLASMGHKARLTLGNNEHVAEAMTALGHCHERRESARDIVVDDGLRLVTTPAYMFENPSLADVHAGIDACVAEVLRHIR